MATPSIETRSLVPRHRARASEVFVSPRVIDTNAFDELASSLRDLIDETNTRANGLQRAHQEAIRLTSQMGSLIESTRQLHANLTRASERGDSSISILTSQIDKAQTREQQALDAERALSLRICESEQRHDAMRRTIEGLLQRLESAQTDTPPGTPNTTDNSLARLEGLEQRISALESTPAPTTTEPPPAQEHASLELWKKAIDTEQARARDLLDETRALRKVVTTAKKQVASTILRASEVADHAEHASEENTRTLEAARAEIDSLASLLKQANHVQTRLAKTLASTQ
ncbi:MAG: hypothetical protein ACYTF7_00595 [Planctomycetota bacterium]|jgi:hypothetical protein